MELNREQIVKALECCAKVGGHRDAHYCNDCPLHGERCALKLPKNAIALIREQDERIAAFVIMLTKAYEFCKKTKADTVRKMQERLHENFRDSAAYTRSYIHDGIDQIAKEMWEDNT